MGWRHSRSSGQYEGEYRLVSTDEGEAGFIKSTAGIAPFPPVELTGVYVGCTMPDACIRAVVNEVSNRSDPLPVHQMTKVPHRLALEAKRIYPSS
jgi:hypothetical protein